MGLYALKFSNNSSFGGFLKLVVLVLNCVLLTCEARGLLLLYRPRDVTNDCAVSEHIRFDLSFGMGMSDTITLVFRTLSEIDYECGVDIVTEKDVSLLVVLRFPNSVTYVCERNPFAFTILKKEKCVNLCESLPIKPKNEFVSIALRSRFRFRFVSNSSINADMQAHLYEVTATAARSISNTPKGVCNKLNETICVMDGEKFCFTSGVVCDGIKNCGEAEWFDERKSDCKTPRETIGHSPVIALGLALACALIAAVHITIKCLPPAAQSFFIFNINEDNRLCIEPVFRVPSGSLPHIEKVKRHSIIPVEYSSSTSSVEVNDVQEQSGSVSEVRTFTFYCHSFLKANPPHKQRKNTMKIVTKLIQEKFKSVAQRNIRKSETAASSSVRNTFSDTKTKSFIA